MTRRDVVEQIVETLDRRVADGTAVRLGDDAYRLLPEIPGEDWIDARKRGAQADQ